MIDLAKLRKEIKIPPRGAVSIACDCDVSCYEANICLVVKRLDDITIADMVYALLASAYHVMLDNDITEEEDMVSILYEQWQRVMDRSTQERDAE